MINPLLIRSLVNITIPAVYSDALSYEEQIGVLTAKINEVINALNGMTSEEIKDVIEAYLTPEKIAELLEGDFGTAIDTHIAANNENYYTKTETSNLITSTVSAEARQREIADGELEASITQQVTSLSTYLSTNYYSKTQTESKIAESLPDMTGYATLQDAIDIDEASMAIEVEARNTAIAQALAQALLSYYTKTQIDLKESTLRSYVDATGESLASTLGTAIANSGWSSYSYAAGSAWVNTFGNVAAKYTDYNSGVTSDTTYMNLDYAENYDQGLGDKMGEIHLHGYITPISSSTINPGTTTGLMYIPFKLFPGSNSELKILATIIDTSTAVNIEVPMSLVPTESGDTILVYKNVNGTLTPGFSATNKRIYIDTSAVYNDRP